MHACQNKITCHIDRKMQIVAPLHQRTSNGPDNRALCGVWAKGGGLLCPRCREVIESEGISPFMGCLHSPFSPGTQGSHLMSLELIVI